jgi:hypothetical protein
MEDRKRAEDPLPHALSFSPILSDKLTPSFYDTHPNTYIHSKKDRTIEMKRGREGERERGIRVHPSTMGPNTNLRTLDSN